MSDPSSPNLDGLTALRQAHMALLQRLEDATGDDADPRQEREALRTLQPDIQALVEQGARSGGLIEDPRERSDAQVLLDYWRSALGHAGILVPATRLEAFDASRLPELPDDRCPYVGLEPFREAQCAHFRGRDADAQLLVQRLHQHPLLIVLGASGSGKSSLVLAGVLPLLRSETTALGAPAWAVQPETVPGEAMWRPLLEGLGAAPGAEADTPADAAADTTADAQALLQRLDAGDAPAVITLDQFEEVFTLSSVERREALMQTLAALLGSPRGHRVLLTVREEFRAQVGGLQALSRWLTGPAWYQINPMSYEALKAAVEEPARSVGLQFQPGVTDDLVRRVLGQPSALPLLQYALGRLWAMRDRNRITHAVYARLGDPLQALMRSADEFYARLAPQTQQEVRRVLLALVRIDDRLDVYRQPRRRQELLADGNAQTADAIDRLLRQGYVRNSRMPSEGDERLSICHEALVRNWPRLVDWIDEERRIRQQRLAFSQAAARWHADGRPQQGLLTAWQIDGVRGHADRLSGIERAFFDASVHAVEAAQNEQLRLAREETERERQRSAEAERQARKALELAAQEEALRRKARHQLWGVLAATPLVIGAIAYFAWQKVALNEEARLVDARQREAREAQQTADQQLLAQRRDDPSAQTDWQFAATLSRDLFGPVSSEWTAGTGKAPSAEPAAAATDTPRVTVSLHIADAAQRPRAQLLAAELRRSGLDVLRIVVVAPARVPPRSDVRYFHEDDVAAATRIATALRSTLSATAEAKPKPVTDRADPVPLGHIELWFARDALQATDAAGTVSTAPTSAGPATVPPRPGDPTGPAPATPIPPIPPAPPATTAPGPAPAAHPPAPPPRPQPSEAPAAPASAALPTHAAAPAATPVPAPAAAPAAAPAPTPAPSNPHSTHQRVQLLIHRLEHHNQRATRTEGLNSSHLLRFDWAANWARHLNIQTPLGLAVLYDTEVSLRSGKLLDKPVQPLPAGNRAAEKAWLLHYLDLRADPLQNPKAQQPLEQQRIAELRRLVQGEQWDLAGERPVGP